MKTRSNDGLLIKILNLFLGKSLDNTDTVFISDTTARTGLDGYAIKAIEDTVISSISYTVSGKATSNSLASETIAKGDVWYLKNITEITLTSGACFIYNN